MRFRLRTLLIVLVLGPPLLWGAYLVLSPSGRLLLVASFVIAFLVCVPWAYLVLTDNWQK